MKFDERLLDIMRNAKSVIVVTGSGVSSESGVPTFRGDDGLWRSYKAEELATPQAFAEDPELIWRWYDWRRGLISKAVPNPAHLVISEMEARYPEFLLVTQNVDGLHRKAGSEKIVEIHGNIWKVRCTSEGKEFFMTENPLKEMPPRCDCGALLRPAVVWFGEMLPVEALATVQEHLEKADVLLTIGTSGVVYPVASFPMIAKASGSLVVEINLGRTPITGNADFSIFGKAGGVLPALWKAAKLN